MASDNVTKPCSWLRGGMLRENHALKMLSSESMRKTVVLLVYVEPSEPSHHTCTGEGHDVRDSVKEEELNQLVQLVGELREGTLRMSRSLS